MIRLHCHLRPVLFVFSALALANFVAADDDGLASTQALLNTSCIDCHNASDAQSGINVEELSLEGEPLDAATLERIVRKLANRQMPPLDYSDRPTSEQYDSSTAFLADLLDKHAAASPEPGDVPALRRLTRTEYQNAIRDLLQLDVNASDLLPDDSSSGGFDNITVNELSPARVSRYINAAEKISRLAIGTPGIAPRSETIRIKPDITQKAHVPGLPFGTRGGALIPFTFSRPGKYRIDIRLARDRNEHVEGMNRPAQLDVLLDRKKLVSFDLEPPQQGDHSQVDAHLTTVVDVQAGPQQLGVTFVDDGQPLIETMRQPLQSQFNVHRHPRQHPALYQVSITGPLNYADTSQEMFATPSRIAVFGRDYQAGPGNEAAEAQRIILRLAQRAYRRGVKLADVESPLAFYQSARSAGGGFEDGIQAALSAILVSPHFLFRAEVPPADVASGEVYTIPDVELASRLSFFLWSSLPDDELLISAGNNELQDEVALTAQVDRMLADPRSVSLTSNFAAQWLYLRNLDSLTPDGRLFPDFDDNLRQAFRTETEMLFQSVVQDDKSILKLIDSDYTFLNERLARHYGIPHIYGSHFRRVPVDKSMHRGGILRHGSILTATSYATRTSPVIRGYWILKNLLASPPPPPPENVPPLEDNTVSASLPLRERLAEHRNNAACIGCHQLMDPLGFALENYDAIGRWREMEAGEKIDASGVLADGSSFTSIDELEQALLQNPDLFASALTEKLMMFAIGRPIEHYDAPAVRAVVRRARENDYRFSSIVQGIVASDPFQKRRAP